MGLAIVAITSLGFVLCCIICLGFFYSQLVLTKRGVKKRIQKQIPQLEWSGYSAKGLIDDVPVELTLSFWGGRYQIRKVIVSLPALPRTYANVRANGLQTTLINWIRGRKSLSPNEKIYASNWSLLLADENEWQNGNFKSPSISNFFDKSIEQGWVEIFSSRYGISFEKTSLS